MSLEDCCIGPDPDEEAKNSETRYRTQISTTLEMHRDFRNSSVGEIASDYRARPIIGELLYA